LREIGRYAFSGMQIRPILPEKKCYPCWEIHHLPCIPIWVLSFPFFGLFRCKQWHFQNHIWKAEREWKPIQILDIIQVFLRHSIMRVSEITKHITYGQISIELLSRIEPEFEGLKVCQCLAE
jgi:hypothetical protein